MPESDHFTGKEANERSGEKQTSSAPQIADAVPGAGTCLYDTSKEALESLCDGFNYWTGKLTESSFALSLAVIGANWAVFGSVDKIRHNLLAETSMSLVIGSLVVGLFGNWLLGGMLRRRIRYGEEDAERWAKEFAEARGKAVPWPSTWWIDAWAAFFRLLKTWLPIAGGGCFLMALFCSNAAPTTQNREGPGTLSNPLSLQTRVHATAMPAVMKSPALPSPSVH